MLELTDTEKSSEAIKECVQVCRNRMVLLSDKQPARWVGSRYMDGQDEELSDVLIRDIQTLVSERQ